MVIFLIRKDYDNDGYTDLCIPYISSDKFIYYHFDLDTAQYEKWNFFNELNSVIIKYFINNSDCESSYIIKIGDNQNTIYKCNGIGLKYTGKETTYTGNNSFIYLDTYLLSENSNKEQLIERKKLKMAKQRRFLFTQINVLLQ